MKYQLFDFQKAAVSDLLKKMESMQRSYEADGSLSAVSLTAPTGSGKTVICAAAAEGLFFGNDTYAGDPRALILWLSDSPSLNSQTRKRFEDATDLLNGATSLEEIGPDFAKSHRKLERGKVYFLNRQLLGKGKTLTNEAEGGRSFYDILNNTIEDDGLHLYLFIDEAHKGLGKGGNRGTSDNENKTIYSTIIDGQAGKNKPMPCVIGISATPENYNKAMAGRTNRDLKSGVNVPVSEVKKSGIIKDTIELRTPKKAADTKHQDLTQACKKLADSSRIWKDYCTKSGITPVVIPLMVVQVEDSISPDTLGSLCSQIHKTLPWLDTSDCFANVFGEEQDITASGFKVPYVKPDEVQGKANIKILFAKDAVTSGWDCPRAEVIYSRRKRKDPTYIAQMIGRMVRTPLARRIDSVEELNMVACYLPEYDADTVDAVVKALKEDNIADGTTTVITNPVDVAFFGHAKEAADKQLDKVREAAKKLAAGSTPEEKKEDKPSDQDNQEQKAGETASADAIHETSKDGHHVETNHADDGNNTGTESKERSDEETSKDSKSGVKPDIQLEDDNSGEDNEASGDEFAVNTDDDLNLNLDELNKKEKELKETLDRIPKVDSAEILKSFETIITRQVRHDKTNNFLDLWDCIDVIAAEIDPDADLESKIQEDFFNNVEGEIKRHPQEFKRTLNEIQSTIIIVRRVDPLTGEEYSQKEDSVLNDAERITTYYQHTVNTFAGASDLVKYYINRWMAENNATHNSAISRICAVGYCMEIVQALEVWAEKKTNDLLNQYGPSRYAVISEENKEKWDRIEGNTKPYIERTLNINASITRQDKSYDKYPKHIISDSEGWAYLKLGDLEKKVVKTELAKALNVAFYRNQSRNLNASFSIPYLLNGDWENFYPDFIFFQKIANGKIVRSIVDPHGDWLGDSIAKLKGYVGYLKDHPDMFGSVLAVTDEKGGECRYLDLMDKKVQAAIESFTGDTAKELFTGALSRPYFVKTD